MVLNKQNKWKKKSPDKLFLQFLIHVFLFFSYQNK